MKLRVARFFGRAFGLLLFLLMAASAITTLCPVGAKRSGPGVSGSR